MTLSITGKKSLAAGKAGRRGGASHETAWEVDDAHRIKEGNGIAGWLFVVPALLIALTFVIAPLSIRSVCRSPMLLSPIPVILSGWNNTRRCFRMSLCI